MRSVIISNQDVIDLLLDFSLPSAPGSCHSRTPRLSGSRGRHLYIIIFPSTLTHTFSFEVHAHTHKISLCVAGSLAQKANTHRCFLLHSALQSPLAAYLQPQQHKKGNPLVFLGHISVYFIMSYAIQKSAKSC